MQNFIEPKDRTITVVIEYDETFEKGLCLRITGGF